MSARADRTTPVVMVEVREYVLCHRFAIVMCRARHRTLRNDQPGAGARTWWHGDGRIEIVH